MKLWISRWTSRNGTAKSWESMKDLRVCRGDLGRERETVGSQKCHFQFPTNPPPDHPKPCSRGPISLFVDIDLYPIRLSSWSRRRRYEKGYHGERAHTPEDFVTYDSSTLSSSGSPVNGSEGWSVDFGKAKKEIQANMLYPDQHNHKEILVASSAPPVKKERRFTTFGFDQVIIFYLAIILLSRYLTPFQALEPESTQAEVFREISQFAQSCPDGVVQCLYFCIRANWVWKVIYDGRRHGE